MTKQRAAILEVMQADRSHHTAEEIYELAKDKLPGGMSRATVYNNLKALENAKLIRRITGDTDTDRYDGCYDPHCHLICEECGRIWDFKIPNLEESIAHEVKTDFNSYEMKVRFVCSACTSK